jgi:DNA mismatch repair protein MutL
LRLLGPVRDRYVAAVGEGGLVLISLQAARERILFERLLASAKTRQVSQQPLLIPITLEVPAADSALLKRAGDTLASLGFDISPFGGNTWLLAAVPACYPQENLLAIFRNLVDDLRDNPDSSARRGVLDEPLAASAARAAARAHQPLDELSLRMLVQELDRCELPYAAPDGRPVLVHLSDAELARRFGR